MTNEDRKLVELITQQVLAILQQGDASRAPAASSSSSSAVPHTAPIHPPIGQCTGDYSKFPELAGKLYGNSNTNTREPKTPSPMASPRAVGVSAAPAPDSVYQPLPLTGIITESQLQEAMRTSPDGTVVLAMEARLTPLANDLARQKKELIRRGTAAPVINNPKPTHSVGGSVSAGNQWLWWIEGGCPIVRDVTQAFGLALRPIAAGPTSSALPQVLRELARAVKAKQVAGGVLFVPSASKAVCMANRCQSLRAIVGTCGEAVEQGLREVGANVLIIEYPHHGHRSTTAMLERFTQQLPVVPASVERMLVDMQRCV